MKNTSNLNLLHQLGQDLLAVSRIKNHQQKFRIDYIQQIKHEWKKKHGKKQVQLVDLPNHYKLKFDKSIISIFEDILREVQTISGLDTINRTYKINFYLIVDFLRGKSACLTVKTIKKYVFFFDQQKLDFPLNSIEKRVIAISPGKKSKSLKIKGFPIDFSDEKWAPVFGIILDTCLIKEFLFSSIDINLANYVFNSLKQVGLDPYFKKVKNHYYIKGHNVIRDLMFISGIKSKEVQISSNITLPSWIFNTSNKYKAILLAKFFDTEGSVCRNKGSVRFTQATRLSLDPSEKMFFRKKARKFTIKPSETKLSTLNIGNYSSKLKEKVLANVPLILVSIQLLLRELGINSHLYPLRITLDSKGSYSSLWNLHIQTNRDLNNFYLLTKSHLSIRYKLRRLSKIECNFNRPLPKGIRKSFFLAYAKKIELEKGYFTIPDVVHSSNRNKKSVSNEIGILERTGFVYTRYKVGHTKHRRLTRLGNDFLNENDLNLELFNTLFLSEKPSTSKKM
tara:strand:- start:12730 stop:14253 length:1524 start_codon:yes stop_codon:yes gene_type:complete